MVSESLFADSRHYTGGKRGKPNEISLNFGHKLDLMGSFSSHVILQNRNGACSVLVLDDDSMHRCSNFKKRRLNENLFVHDFEIGLVQDGDFAKVIAREDCILGNKEGFDRGVMLVHRWIRNLEECILCWTTHLQRRHLFFNVFVDVIKHLWCQFIRNIWYFLGFISFSHLLRQTLFLLHILKLLKINLNN